MDEEEYDGIGRRSPGRISLAVVVAILDVVSGEAV